MKEQQIILEDVTVRLDTEGLMKLLHLEEGSERGRGFRGLVDEAKGVADPGALYKPVFIEERGEDLYLGMAVPRAWLADGGAPAIERAATYFGPVGLRYESHAAQGSIRAVLDPPTRRPPKRTFLRFRHPEAKPIVRVEIDGQPWDKIDAKREMVELPPLRGPATITAFYGK